MAVQCDQLPEARSVLDAEAFNDAELTQVVCAFSYSRSPPVCFYFHFHQSSTSCRLLANIGNVLREVKVEKGKGLDTRYSARSGCCG